MNHKKVIVFDFDGVIIDSWAHGYAMNLEDWPDLKPAEHRRLFSGNIHEEVAKMPPSRLSAEQKEQYMQEVYYPQKKTLSVFAGIGEVIKKLAEHSILVINTSADAFSTEEYLKNVGLYYFDAVYGTEISKNKAEKFELIFSDYKTTAAECLFITDTIGDVREAEKSGIPTVAVTYGFQDRSYFAEVEENVIGFADSPADILRFIRG